MRAPRDQRRVPHARPTVDAPQLRQPVLIIPLTRLDGTSDVALPDPVGARATEHGSG